MASFGAIMTVGELSPAPDASPVPDASPTGSTLLRPEARHPSTIGPLPSKGCPNGNFQERTPETDSGTAVSDITLGEDSVATGHLMVNPPGRHAVIRKSAYALPAASLTFKDLTFSLPACRYSTRMESQAQLEQTTQEEPHGCLEEGVQRETAETVEKTRSEKKVGKMILEPCSGHFEAGELVAMMGPSGCGKTTLLDMLAAKKPDSKYSGQVLVNGRPRDRLFRRIAAYVGQEDMMPAHWTVREAIKFNATLKRQPKRSHEGVDGWIEVLLETFALAPVAETYIGSPEVRGISGGQRRRVTLARGVAAHASLLFCDEPTSGLSATDAELCVKALRTVAKRLGAMCLVVIHQPRHEVAMLFDQLVLLTSSPGRMVYSGPMEQAQQYWRERGFPVPANINPTDYYLDLLTPGTQLDQSEAFVQAFKEVQKPILDERVDQAQRILGATVSAMLASDDVPRTYGPHAVSFWTQLGALLRRKIRITLRNPMALGLPLFIPMVQGFIVGYMFEGIGEKELLRQVMFVFCLLTMLCLAGTMSLIVLITDRTLMKYETSEALYSEGAWSVCSFLVDVPLGLLGALLNVVVMVAFARLENALFLMVMKWSLLLFFVYDSLFAFIGAVAADTRQAQVIATPFVSIFMLFNGFVVSMKDAPVTLHWIFHISPNAYAMQAIVVQMAKGAGWQGEMLLKQFGYSEDIDEMRGVEALVGMIILLRVGQQWGLRYLNHVQR